MWADSYVYHMRLEHFSVQIDSEQWISRIADLELINFAIQHIWRWSSGNSPIVVDV